MAQGTATMEGDHNTHGAPLPQDEIDATKEKLGLPSEPFYLPEEVVTYFQSRFDSLKEKVSNWNSDLVTACENADFKKLWDTTVLGELGEIDFPEFDNWHIHCNSKSIWHHIGYICRTSAIHRWRFCGP